VGNHQLEIALEDGLPLVFLISTEGFVVVFLELSVVTLHCLVVHVLGWGQDLSCSLDAD